MSQGNTLDITTAKRAALQIQRKPICKEEKYPSLMFYFSFTNINILHFYCYEDTSGRNITKKLICLGIFKRVILKIPNQF